MKYVCMICGKEYNTRNAIRSHLRRVHKWNFEKGDSRELTMRIVEKQLKKE